MLSRADAPEQRLTFLSGQTGPADRPLLNTETFVIAGFKVAPPTDVQLSGTSGQSVEIEPTGAEVGVVNIEGRAIKLEPDRRYRITLTRIPMGGESATVIAVAESPPDRYESFTEMVDKVLLSLDF